MQLQSPGKLSVKVGGAGNFAEQELAHDSHLIQHSEQPAQFSRPDLDVFQRPPRYNEQARTGSKSHWQQEQSFDVEFMMPPDITSIDSDINKIGALTPSPLIGDIFDPPFTAHTISGTHVSRPQGLQHQYGPSPQNLNAMRHSDSEHQMYDAQYGARQQPLASPMGYQQSGGGSFGGPAFDQGASYDSRKYQQQQPMPQQEHFTSGFGMQQQQYYGNNNFEGG